MEKNIALGLESDGYIGHRRQWESQFNSLPRENVVRFGHRVKMFKTKY